MINTMSKVGELTQKTVASLKNEGVGGFLTKAKNWTIFNVKKKMGRDVAVMRDILFINGCMIDYCARYRVVHKMEELIAYGMTCDVVNDGFITDDMLKRYRGFVIYRAPHSDKLEKFVKKAKEQNKTVFYDVDDLIFDLKYTRKLKSLEKLPKKELELYEDGVRRYGKMMQMCDYCITTTRVLAKEMEKHGKETCIDKNVGSVEMKKYSEDAIREVERDEEKITIGYASGSLTHNEDFELIKPALIKILEKYDNVQLKLVGALDLPEDLKAFEERILTTPFMDYKKLPAVLRSFDINLAPLETSLFNAAKSSIKWMEAGLVEVPTVASDVGDFHDSITDGVDGILSKDDEWFEKIEKLVTDEELREKIGRGAYETTNKKYITYRSGKTISDFVKAKLSTNIYFMLPGVTISGGILIAKKHAEILRERGYDVTMLNLNRETADVTELGEGSVNVMPFHKMKFEQHVDKMVATMWLTLPYVMDYPTCKDKRYLVQSQESRLYKLPDPRILEANATYNEDGVKYLTISKWCEGWLKEDFGKKAMYAPNGIDLEKFPYKERKFGKKIKVLIEGDPGSHYKNVDESFKIANRLDRGRFEVNFVSYNKEPKKWYKYDKFYNNVKHEEMYKIYQESDILLKSSKLESFSYPPLEMMATGGYVVVAPNEGNVEYLEDGKNCLFYEPGNIEDGVKKIEEMVENNGLRKKLAENAKKIVERRSWEKIKAEVVKLYEGE